MGSIRVGSVVVDIRGKVGEQVYSRGPGGLQVRSVGTWEQPNTQRQVDVRTISKKLAVAWSTLLTESQRAGWRAYGRQWPRVNKWGEPLNIGGYQCFFRACHYYFRGMGDLDPGHAVVDGDLLVKDAPSGGGYAAPLLTFSAAAGTDELTLTVPPTNYEAMPLNCYVWLFGGKPVGPGVQWFGGPWRYIGANAYWGAWGEDPWVVTHPWAFDPGEKIHIECVLQQWFTGEISTRGRMVGVAT